MLSENSDTWPIKQCDGCTPERCEHCGAPGPHFTEFFNKWLCVPCENAAILHMED